MRSKPTAPDPEVPAKATRRRFSAVEKVRILDEYERGSAIERAALCRREKIYSPRSTVVNSGLERISEVAERMKRFGPAIGFRVTPGVGDARKAYGSEQHDRSK